LPSVGVSLAGPTGAVTVNPVQTTTYQLQPTSNPITFGSGANIKVAGVYSAAVKGGTAARYSITNQGYLRGGYYGIELARGAMVTNAGTISGGRRGIVFAAGGTVANAGTIAGYDGVELALAGVVTNTGTIGSYTTRIGVLLDHGGSVTNAASGRVNGGVSSAAGTLFLDNAGYLYAGGTAVTVHGGATISNAADASIVGGSKGMQIDKTSLAVTVTNAGKIGGARDPRNGLGVEIDADNVVLNNLSTGNIYAPALGAMKINGNGVRVTNAGQISANSNFGPGILAQRDTIVNLSSGVITGFFYGVGLAGGRLTNAGKIESEETVAVMMNGKGSIFNKVGGIITGYQTAVDLNGGAGSTLINGGMISATTGDGVIIGAATVSNWAKGVITGTNGVFAAGGSVTNAGKITGSSADGVQFSHGGALTNVAGASIKGHVDGLAVGGGAGTVTNSGQITGVKAGVLLSTGGSVANKAGGQVTATTYKGVGMELDGAGSVTNQAGGQITATYGVIIKGGASSITNAGTIAGTFASVMFEGGGANTLTLNTGSSLLGAAVGGTVSGASNSLVLKGTGTANNRFFYFDRLAKQGPGTWTLNGSSDFGGAIIGAGVLQVGDAAHAGVQVVVTGSMVNNGVLVAADGEIDIAGAVSGGGSASIGAGSVLNLESSFSQNVAFTATTGVLKLAQSQTYNGTISGLAGNDAIDLADVEFNGGTHAVFTDNGAHTGGVLTVANGTETAHIRLAGDYTTAVFAVFNDPAGGTDVAVQDGGAAARPASTHALVHAIAAMGGSQGGDHGTASPEPGRTAALLLTTPHPGGRSYG
jgi:hypothetical protein